MKFIEVENNLTEFGYGHGWFIKSDKPINQKSYYFEFKLKDKSLYSSGFIGYLHKNEIENNFDYIEDGYENIRKIYAPSFVVLSFPEQNQFFIDYNNREEQEIIKISSSITPATVLNSIVGLGIKLNSDKSVNLDVYVNGVLKDSIIKENFDDFDFNNLYIATFHSWNHNNQTAQYYFEKDLKYQNIASKYNKKFILFESGGGCIK